MATIKQSHGGQWVGLYEEGNIRIICKMATETSEIFNRTMSIVTDIVIADNNLNVYQISNIMMPYDYEGKISISDYVEKIVMYIKHTEDGMHGRKLFLDKFFLDYNTMHLDIYYRNKIRELQEKEAQQQQATINNEIKQLKNDIQQAYNSIGYAVTMGYSDIFIIDKAHTTDTVIKDQNNLYDMFNAKNSRDDKTEVRKNFLYKHIERGFNNEEYINILKQELKNIA